MAKNTLFEDFDIYARALIGSLDVDPIYPFIKTTLEYCDFEPKWFCFAYTTFYSLESAMKFCRAFPDEESYNTKKFFDLRSSTITKMGIERRGKQRNMISQDEMFKGWIKANQEWVLNYTDNNTFRTTIMENIPFHGVWASFKIAEVFEKSLDLKQLAVPDLGLDGRDPNSNDGPVSGLRWLCGRDEIYDKSIFPYWNRFGKNLAEGYGCDIGEIESSICKFHKLITGNYYVGHDIDEINEVRPVWGEVVFDEIMEQLFNKRFYQGVHGIRKELKHRYKDNREIVNSDLGSFYPKLNVLEILLNS